MTAGEVAPVRLPLENTRIPIFLVKQTPRSAYEHMKRELTKFSKWRKKGYSFNYGPPHHQLVDELIKSDVPRVEWDKVQRVVESEIYPHFDFEPAVQSVKFAMPEVDKALAVFQTYKEKWGFKLFPTYEIELVVGTIGGGGSWQTENDIDGGIPNGVITFWQNPDPTKRGRTPAERIVHEIVHIGIEELLTQICKDAGKPALHQKTKERLVDLIVQKAFQVELFPNYHMQKNQDERIDSYITNEALLDLPKAIKCFVTEKEPLPGEQGSNIS